MGIARDWKVVLFGAMALVLAGLLAACSEEQPAPTATSTPAATGKQEALRVIVASSDLAVGQNRFTFGLLDDNSSPIRAPEVALTFYDLRSNPPQAKLQASAMFRQWPSGAAGVYVTQVSFDYAGPWGVEVQVTTDGGQTEVGTAGFMVKEDSASPGIGEPAPRSRNKTARDVPALEQLTSAAEPDPELYQMTIAEAIDSGKPTLVSFATPAFCQTQTCGPQVEVVSRLKEKYRGRVNFIHVEVFDNPEEMRGDISRGRVSPVLQEWGLQTEPFTFVLDSQGRVSGRFEGFTTEAELDDALARVAG